MVQQLPAGSQAQDFRNVLQTTNEVSIKSCGEFTAISGPQVTSDEEDTLGSLIKNERDDKAAPKFEFDPEDEEKLEEGFLLFGRLMGPMQDPALRFDSAISVQSKTFECDLDRTSEHSSSGLTTEATTHSGLARSVVIDFGVAMEKRLAKMKTADAISDLQVPTSAGGAAGESNRVEEQLEFRATADSIKPDTTAVDALQNAERMTPHGPDSSQMSTMDADISRLLANTGNQQANPVLQPSQQIAKVAARQIEELERSSFSSLRNVFDTDFKGQSVRMTLHPAELGAVEITVSRRGKRLEVLIVPEAEATSRILREDAGQLLQSLGISDARSNQIQVRIGSDTMLTELGNSVESSMEFDQSQGSRSSEGNLSQRSKGVSRTNLKSGDVNDAMEGDVGIRRDTLRRSDAVYV